MAITNILERLGIDPRYEVKDLYVGALFTPVRKEKNVISFIPRNTLIIFNRKKYYESKYDEKHDIGWYGNYVGVDIFTNKEYVFAKGSNTYTQHWDLVSANIGGMVIGKYTPLENFLDSPKKFISKTELLEIYNKLNSSKPQKTPKEKNDNVDITDAILKTILETKELVKNALIEDKLKTKIVGELEELGNYYVEEMLKIVDGNEDALSFENEYSLRMKVIKRLAEIEGEIKDPGYARKHSLKQQYGEFVKKLNEE